MNKELVDIIREAGGNEYDIERLHFLRTPSSLSPDTPAFYMKIVLNPQRGTLVQKIERGSGFYTAPPGNYACFPAWDWKKDLLSPEEETVTIPLELLKQIDEAFRTRVISDEAWSGVKEALAKK